MKSLRIIAVAGALAIGLCHTATADVVIRMTRTNLQSEKPASATGTMTLASDRLAVKWEGGAAEEMSHVRFRGDRELIWVLYDADKSYLEVTKAEMTDAGSQINAAMAEMKAELEKMPPEQRKMVEEMMKKNPAMGGGGAGAKKPERKVTRTAESKTISGFPCTKHEIALDGRKSSEVWVTPFDKAGLKTSDLAVFKQFTGFLDELLTQLGRNGSAMGSSFAADPGAINGVPIRTVNFDLNGKPSEETTFDSIARSEVPSSSYELPTGYARKEMFKKSK